MKLKPTQSELDCALLIIKRRIALWQEYQGQIQDTRGGRSLLESKVAEVRWAVVKESLVDLPRAVVTWGGPRDVPVISWATEEHGT